MRLSKDVIDDVASAFGVTPELMRSNSRTDQVVLARQFAMLMLREELDWSYPRIGRALHRDHSTVVYGVRAARRRIESDPDVRAMYHTLVRCLAWGTACDSAPQQCVSGKYYQGKCYGR